MLPPGKRALTESSAALATARAPASHPPANSHNVTSAPVARPMVRVVPNCGGSMAATMPRLGPLAQPSEKHIQPSHRAWALPILPAMREQSLAFLRELLNTPSPSGFEARGQRVWLDYVQR